MASEPNHHDMANTLKEMLKINSASNVPGKVVGFFV